PIPLFNYDVQMSAFPEPVRDLQDRIRAADGLLIVTPEYHHSIPGVLKNAIDWATRGESPLAGKPVGIMGAATGGSGTRWGQMHFRQVCQATEMIAMNRPEVYLSDAAARFDAAGSLTDAAAEASVREFMLALAQ